MSMGSVKSLSLILGVLGLSFLYQNCSSSLNSTTYTLTSAPIIREQVSPSVTKITIPISNTNSQDRAELSADGNVINTASGEAYSIEDDLKSEIQQVTQNAEICLYKLPPLGPDQVSCLALSLPHAFAVDSQGQEFPLSLSICHQDTYDLCQDSRENFARLVRRIQDRISPQN